MKKLLMLLLAVLIFFAAFILEGGGFAQLIAPTALVPIIFCTLLATLFTHNFSEIKSAFLESFINKTDKTKGDIYRLNLLVIKNLQQSILYWSLTMLIIALIMIFWYLRDPYELGHSLSVAFLCLLYGFGFRALLLVPMEQSISKKLLLIENQ